jgi:hypothetical protein
MSYARDLLELAPADGVLGAAEVAAAIERCAGAEQACILCADLSLAGEAVADLSACVALCSSCADLCAATVRVLARPAHWDRLVLHRQLRACVRTCERCSAACARHADHHRHCAICAKACRACEAACAALLEAEAFTELEKLAGG